MTPDVKIEQQGDRNRAAALCALQILLTTTEYIVPTFEITGEYFGACRALAQGLNQFQALDDHNGRARSEALLSDSGAEHFPEDFRDLVTPLLGATPTALALAFIARAIFTDDSTEGETFAAEALRWVRKASLGEH